MLHTQEASAAVLGPPGPLYPTGDVRPPGPFSLLRVHAP